jgi:Putative beta-barrel porin-2, OmpL-like. bbp2
MKSIPKRKNPMIIVAAGGLLSITMGATTSYAAPGMVAALTKYDINETKLLKDNGIVIGLWSNAGITYNAASPTNNFNGPVTFGDRSGEFQLNQLNLFIQRAVATEGDK